MHTRASTSELVTPLAEPERTLNRRLCRNKRVPFKRRYERPESPREIYPPILDITHFQFFLNLSKIYDLMVDPDDQPMWAADHVVPLTTGLTITIPATANEFQLKQEEYFFIKPKIKPINFSKAKSYSNLTGLKTKKPKAFIRKTIAFADEGNSNSDTDKIIGRMDAMALKMDAQYKQMKSRIECNNCGVLVKICKIPWNNNLNHLLQQLFNIIVLYHCSIKFLSFYDHFKMSTLAEFMIVAAADNRPPMLDKTQYEFCKSRMELYIQGKDNGRIILNLVKNGLLVWPTVALENGTVRPKTYEELSDKEKLQADYDLKATNIVLQGLPPDVYAIVNHHKVAKDIWDIVKLLMQGTSLSKQVREYKLYDEFDKFSYVKVQVNTKFLNSLPPEWGAFVTDVQLARELHMSNYDQLYAYLEQHESNPYRAPHHSQQYPTTYPTNLSHTQSSITQYAYPPLTIPQQPQAEFPQIDLGLAVLTFLPGDDPIACMNKAIAFLLVVFTPCYPSTNNQLRSSSNLRNQATVQDGRVTVQQVQGRQDRMLSVQDHKGILHVQKGIH
nr:hypothetical protein [Tanacetum cinerariifolium]